MASFTQAMYYVIYNGIQSKSNYQMTRNEQINTQTSDCQKLSWCNGKGQCNGRTNTVIILLGPVVYRAGNAIRRLNCHSPDRDLFTG